MGIVFRAYDAGLDRQIAIKRLHDCGPSERLLREAQAMAQLAHPNVVAVYEVGVTDDAVYVAMEFVDRRPLTRGSSRGRGVRDILDVFAQAGARPGGAHASGCCIATSSPTTCWSAATAASRVATSGSRVPLADDELRRGRATRSPRCRSELTGTGAAVGTPRLHGARAAGAAQISMRERSVRLRRRAVRRALRAPSVRR